MIYTLFFGALCFVIGYFSKGITININKKEDEFPQDEYNASTTHLLDPEVREYLDKNFGDLKL